MIAKAQLFADDSATIAPSFLAGVFFGVFFGMLAPTVVEVAICLVSDLCHDVAPFKN